MIFSRYVVGSHRIAGILLLFAFMASPAMAAWQISMVDPIQAPAHELPLSIAYDARGVLHIAYYDPNAEDIRHAWRNGTSWGMEIVGPSAGTRSVSLAFDPEGHPCISYGDGVSYGNLVFARKTEDGWLKSTVTRGEWGLLGNAGSYSSLAFDRAGAPHIAYIDGSSYASLYYASLNKTTATWETAKVFSGDSSTTATGFESSLAFNNKGWPYIAFIDMNDEEHPHLMYTYHNGVTWHTSYLDYGTASMIKAQNGIQFALDSRGYPHFSFYGEQNEKNQYLGYLTGDGSRWISDSIPLSRTPSPQEYQPLGEYHTSMAIDSHNAPHISFISTTGHLMYATKTTPGSWSLYQVDPSITAYYHAIAINKNGHPTIAYLNATDSKLMVAQEIG